MKIYISSYYIYVCIYFLYVKSYVAYLFSTLWRCVFGRVAETKESKQYHEQHNTDSTSPSPLFSMIEKQIGLNFNLI